MGGFLGFLVFLALIVVGGYLNARKDANSTPLNGMPSRAAFLWNSADPRHRAMMLASIGILEDSPSFAVYLTSTWTQLDYKICTMLAATLAEIETAQSESRTPILVPEVALLPTERNPALDELRDLPQTAITAGLIAAVPGLATELYAEANKQASALGITDPSFTDCVFDLLLVGAFGNAANFADDKNVASLFVDALVFKATGRSPSEPPGVDMMGGLTSTYHGIAKYAIAKRYYSVPDPGAWLFGTEYARAKGEQHNPACILEAGQPVLYIRRIGAWAAEKALTGKSPSQEAMETLPNAIKTSAPGV